LVYVSGRTITKYDIGDDDWYTDGELGDIRCFCPEHRSLAMICSIMAPNEPGPFLLGGGEESEDSGDRPFAVLNVTGPPHPK
jgi:hypothetical protein